MSKQEPNDPWKNYPKNVQDKLKHSKIIEDAVRNMKARGYTKEQAQKVTGAPYERVDSIYKEQREHDTSKRHGEDD
jgi:hypothetical protein